MRNGWTGGQYSVFRALLGAYLCFYLARLLPEGMEIFSSAGMLEDPRSSPFYRFFPSVLFVADAPWLVTSLLLAGAALALLLALGYRDRAAALALLYLLGSLLARNPRILNPSLPFAGWLLLAHAMLPRAPFGSWDSRWRDDPGGGWRLPDSIFAVAWIFMAITYSYVGYLGLSGGQTLGDNPVAWGAAAFEVGFAPLALFRRLRPLLWLSMLGLHAPLLAGLDFAGLSIGTLLLGLFAFDPAWVKPRLAGAPATLFYDGGCGLCHRAVRFLLAEDREGDAFRFAPFESEAFATAVSPAERVRLPDSVVLRLSDGRLLVRSRAVLEAAHRLGGLWSIAAWAIGLIPLALLDGAYDFAASIRSRLFARPVEACPAVTPELRARFVTR